MRMACESRQDPGVARFEQRLEQLRQDFVAQRARDVPGLVGRDEDDASGLCGDVGIDRIDVRQARRFINGSHGAGLSLGLQKRTAKQSPSRKIASMDSCGED